MEISKNLVNSLAPDTSVLADGQALVRKGNFIALNKDNEGSIIFGQCSGSGKKPYSVSVDFINSKEPISRCSCPSRKIPCKHAIGLMLAYCDNKEFSVADIPEDIIEKRNKIAKRTEKKIEKTDSVIAEKKPKKVNKAAAVKKIKIQLDGLEVAEKILFSIMQDGFASIDEKAASDLAKQVKHLGDYYIPGVQEVFWKIAELFENEYMEKEEIYSEVYQEVLSAYALIKKGREYLNSKSNDPDMKKDVETEIEALLGYAWRLDELAEYGLAEENVQLMQLSFTCNINETAKRYEEIGIWVNINTGTVYQTRNLRPFSAKAHIAAADSVHDIVSTTIYKYPGKLNPRIRWDSFTLSTVKAESCASVVKNASDDFALLIKSLKELLKNPLADKSPFAVVKYSVIGTVGDDVVIEDKNGVRIVLVDAKQDGWLDTLDTLKLFGKKINAYSACLLRFKYLPDEGVIKASPFALINEQDVIKLGF